MTVKQNKVATSGVVKGAKGCHRAHPIGQASRVRIDVANGLGPKIIGGGAQYTRRKWPFEVRLICVETGQVLGIMVVKLRGASHHGDCQGKINMFEYQQMQRKE